MPPIPAPRPPGFSRRTLLAASAVGLALLSAGCTSSPADEREEVTSEQADELAAQISVQEALVSAFTAAGAADPALAASGPQQLEWVYQHSPFAEAGYRRYPVLRWLGEVPR